jgi:uncharacterized membrane protein YgcG
MASLTNENEQQQQQQRSERPAVLRQGFPIPAELIGFVIGKDGKNIQQIEKASSARLSTKEENGQQTFERDWVYVTVAGSGREVDRAKKLLLLTCIEATQKSAGRSGGGRGGSSGRGRGRGGKRGGRGRGRGKGKGSYNNKGNENNQ